MNGVATTIRKMTAAGAAAGKELVVVASRSNLQLSDIPIKNFPPIGEFELPEYELQKLSFPPILQMLDYIQRERFTEIIISTPGPVGLTALLAAKMLNLQTSGIYHTDFPQYIRILTEDSFLESVAWGYMHWFARNMSKCKPQRIAPILVILTPYIYGFHSQAPFAQMAAESVSRA